jgi:nucleotide-binding universal stress UspA family protein
MTNQNTMTLVVGVDFTPAGDLALEEALHRSRSQAVDLHAVHAVDAVEQSFGDGGSKVERQEDLLRRLPSQIWDHIGTVGFRMSPRLPDLRIHVHVRLGRPSDALMQVAADYEADLVIVGTHGRKGFDKWVLGSVAEELVKKARCSVLVARPKNFEGVHRSERPEPARPGEDLSRRLEVHGPHIYYSSEVYSWATRDVEVLGPTMK